MAMAPPPNVEPHVVEKAMARLDELYMALGKSQKGFAPRAGQQEMMRIAMLAMISGAPDAQGANLAALEGGTGTGKSAANLLAGIVASEITGKPVLYSTATVALQEQLLNKDLAALAKVVPGLTYEVLKGRGRYVCQSKLETAANDGGAQAPQATLDLAEEPSKRPAPAAEAVMRFAKTMAEDLRAGRWDGEIDSLGDAPDPGLWRHVQADSNSCTGNKCGYYSTCTFYKARGKAKKAKIIVANHALVLSTLKTEFSQVNPRELLMIFDEAHHLPGMAVSQFSNQVRLAQSNEALGALHQLMVKSSRLMAAGNRPDVAGASEVLKLIGESLRRMEEVLVTSGLVNDQDQIFRFENGKVPPDIAAECAELTKLARSLGNTLGELVTGLGPDESLSSGENDMRNRAVMELKPYQRRLNEVEQVAEAWSTEEDVPLAKWIQYAGSSVSPDVLMCSSPISAEKTLRTQLWEVAKAAVMTSATLSALGKFEYFEDQAGLGVYPNRRTRIVASPFDYPNQGQLRVADMQNNPKMQGFSEELCAKLPALLAEHKTGQLCLFTSRRQMEACFRALPPELQRCTQVQGAKGRGAMLALHAERVGRGENSILFGLNALGEGVDLVGDLCTRLYIDKLPFEPPNTPIEEAHGDWLKARGRDPFRETAVPRAGQKLNQWVGRAVRSITDYTVVTVFDSRLASTSFGRDLIAGLPNFPFFDDRTVFSAPKVVGGGNPAIAALRKRREAGAVPAPTAVVSPARAQTAAPSSGRVRLFASGNVQQPDDSSNESSSQPIESAKAATPAQTSSHGGVTASPSPARPGGLFKRAAAIEPEEVAPRSGAANSPQQPAQPRPTATPTQTSGPVGGNAPAANTPRPGRVALFSR